MAVAAVATADEVAAIGIDVEPKQSLRPEVARVIARPEEGGVDALTLHVSKEAVFKAWSALGGRIVGPREISVRLSGSRFDARVGRSPWLFSGWVLDASDRVFALAAATRP